MKRTSFITFLMLVSSCGGRCGSTVITTGADAGRLDASEVDGSTVPVDASTVDAADSGTDAGTSGTCGDRFHPLGCVSRQPLDPASHGLAEFGYGDSTETPCFYDHGEWHDSSVYAADGVVWALSTSYTTMFEPPFGLSAYPVMSIRRNDGTGWTEMLTAAGEGVSIYGGGGRFGVDASNDILVTSSTCAFGRLKADGIDCLSGTEDGNLSAQEDGVYFLTADAVRKYASGTFSDVWTLPGGSGLPRAMWHSGADAVVVGSENMVIRIVDGVATEVPDIPVADYYSVAAIDVDRFVVYGSSGMFEYDHGVIGDVPRPIDSCTDTSKWLVGLTSMNGAIYYLLSNELGRIEEGAYIPLFTFPCGVAVKFLTFFPDPARNAIFLTGVVEGDQWQSCGAMRMFVYDSQGMREF